MCSTSHGSKQFLCAEDGDPRVCSTTSKLCTSVMTPVLYSNERIKAFIFVAPKVVVPYLVPWETRTATALGRTRAPGQGRATFRVRAGGRTLDSVEILMWASTATGKPCGNKGFLK